MANLTKVQRRRKTLGVLGDLYAILITPCSISPWWS